MKEIKLKSGLTFTDNRELGCGINIMNVNLRYFDLSYSSSNQRFYVITKGVWLNSEDMELYKSELSIISNGLEEANEYLNSK